MRRLVRVQHEGLVLTVAGDWRVKPLPEHGTNARYRRGCKCERCTHAASRAAKLREIRKMKGYTPFVPADEAVSHIAALRSLGMSLDAIANAAAIGEATAGRISRGEVPEIRRATATRILSVRLDLDALDPEMEVSAVGSSRRVKALRAIGWTLRAQVAELPLEMSTLVRLCKPSPRGGIRVRNAQAIRDLYDRWSMTPGPSTFAVNDAARRGYFPPLAWDDIDDPNEKPNTGRADDTHVDPIAVERTIAGDRPNHLSRAERRAALTYLHSLGLSDSQIGARLGLDKDAAFQARSRAGLPPNIPHNRRSA